MAEQQPSRPSHFTPVDATPFTTPAAADAAPRRARTGWWVALAVSTGLLLGITSLIVWRPHRDEPPAAAAPPPTEKTLHALADAAAPAEPPANPADPGDQRRQTQDQLAEVLDVVDRLRARQVESWAADEFGAAQRLIAEGEKAYGDGRYFSAQQSYRAARAKLAAVEAEIPEVVQRYVDDGTRALLSRDAATAQQAFAAALAIDADNASAHQGLARAAVFDQVRALLAEAEGYERLQQTEKAVASYQRALQLDPSMPQAQAALQRIQAASDEIRFETTMSTGYTALQEGRYDAARAAFAQAEKLQPRSSAARAAITQAENLALADKIKNSLDGAVKAEQAEQWSHAATLYQAALALDKTLENASTGAQRATARARLDIQLEQANAQPERLLDEAVYAEVTALARRAQAVTGAGPRLKRQIASLQQLLTSARTPVVVSLVSDQTTEVTVSRVGNLGRFERHDLTLVPGRYTAVGKRDGYRDVRVEFDVTPHKPKSSLLIKCTEKVTAGD